jgi:hypothetical protein
MKQILRTVVGIILVTLLFLSNASAEHEANHRYTIRGYILEEDETPVPDIVVAIHLDSRPIGSTRTDGQGYYTLRSHLHDGDIGRALVVRAGDRTATIKMKGTRGNRSASRIHYLNFVGENTVEGALGGWRFPAWVYIAVVLLAALLATALLAHRVGRFAKRRKRRSAPSDQKGNSRKPRKKKKKRR